MVSIALLIIVGAIVYFISISRLSKNPPGHLQATYEAKFSNSSLNVVFTWDAPTFSDSSTVYFYSIYDNNKNLIVNGSTSNLTFTTSALSYFVPYVTQIYAQNSAGNGPVSSYNFNLIASPNLASGTLTYTYGSATNTTISGSLNFKGELVAPVSNWDGLVYTVTVYVDDAIYDPSNNIQCTALNEDFNCAGNITLPSSVLTQGNNIYITVQLTANGYGNGQLFTSNSVSIPNQKPGLISNIDYQLE